MDFGKFKYEESKKEKASRRHQSTVIIKEIKLRPKTDKHDLAFKLKHIHRFLGEGNKCKLVIVFRGREIVHPETGQAMLDHVVKGCLDIAAVEQKPIMEGRRMVMIIGPRAGVIRPASVPGAAAPTPGQGDQEGGAKASEPAAAPPIGPRFGAPPTPQKP
jgi:translation initiation factor IF-3